ncbi:hypothetical protein CN264_19095 [Bacillus cereus]|uniref:hypothetical protein n=1 Tax=Bacillus cereus TaxID=1396 RepID=UPI000BF2FE56|nr:hypothetical protein [Bacillus cereus]PFC23513.1 hypothetical protein CN264_19095 [Bacillus cereus]
MAMLTICKHGKAIPMGTKCKCKVRTVPSIKRELSEVDKLRNTDKWKRKTRPRIINRDNGKENEETHSFFDVEGGFSQSEEDLWRE